MNSFWAVVTAFVGVVCLHFIGSVGFNNVLPYIVWVYLIYLLKEGKKYKSFPRKKIAVLGGVILGIGNGLTVEGVLRFGNIRNCLASVILLAVLACCVCRILAERIDINIWSVSGAGLLGIFAATGNMSLYDNGGWWGWGSAFLSWFLLFYFCIECCWRLSGYASVEQERVMSEEAVEKRGPLLWGIGVFLLCVAIDSIFLLAFFPGVMSYDSLKQMQQVHGVAYSNHHPWLHTMLIKGIYTAGQAVLGSNNRAFALYSLFSICILSGSFAGLVAWLKRKGVRTSCLVVICICYLFSPINQMYSITMWKDIPFAVSVLGFSLLLCVMLDRQKEKKSNWKLCVLFVVAGFCVCFFRSNGLYVFLGMIPFLIIAFWKQKGMIFTGIGMVLMLGILYKGPIFRYFEVTEPDTIESLSIPAQQIAAVVAEKGVISEEQKELLAQVIDLDKVPEAYLGSVGCSDAIKILVREKGNQEYITENAGEFLTVWFELFLQNPRIYVKAFINETYGYWYHKVSFAFLWATYIHEDNGMGIYRASQLPDSVVEGIRSGLDGFENFWWKYISIGLFVYIYFICLVIALRKKSRYLLVYLPVLGIWATLLIATPVYADLRYAYAIYLSVPFLWCINGIGEKKK